MFKRPMVHVRMAQVDHYGAKAISSNRQRNMLKLIAGDIWYPKVDQWGKILGGILRRSMVGMLETEDEELSELEGEDLCEAEDQS